MRVAFARPISLLVLVVFFLTACQPPMAMPNAAPANLQSLAVQHAHHVVDSAETAVAPVDASPEPPGLSGTPELIKWAQESVNETPAQKAARLQSGAEFRSRLLAGDPTAVQEAKFRTLAIGSCASSPDDGNGLDCPTGGAPTGATISTPAGGTHNCSTPGQINWSVSGTDAESIVRIYVALLNSSNVVVADYTWCATACGITSRSLSGTFNVPSDGTYTLTLRVDDPISSSDYARDEKTFTTTNCNPNSPPTIPTWSPNTSSINCTANGGRLAWSFTASDVNGNLNRMQASISPSAGVSGTPNNITFGSTGSRAHSGFFDVPSDGTYTITFQAWDAGGLTFSRTQTVTTTGCGPQPPVITAFTPGATAACDANGKIAWSFTASDPDCDISEMYASVSAVPVMTGDSTAAGTVTASGIQSTTYAAHNAFDGTLGKSWISSIGTGIAWIEYAWAGNLAKTVTSYEIWYANGSLVERGPRDWQLQGWNGTSWVTVDTRSNQTGWAAVTHARRFTVASPGTYPKYRLYITNDNYSDVSYNPGVHCVSVAELRLYEDAPKIANFPFVQPCSNTQNGSFTVTGDGTYSFWYIATDSGGRKDIKHQSVTVTGCDPAPKITAWTPTGGTIDCGPTGGVLNWSFTSTSTANQLVKMTASIAPTTGVGGTPNTITFPATGSRTHTGSFSLATDGVYTITFTAEDSRGMVETKTATVTTVNCKAAPTITAWAPNTSAVTCVAGKLNWSVTAKDNQVDLVKLEVIIQQGATVIHNLVETFPATGTRTYSGSSLLPNDGTYVITFRATDANGLTDTKIQSVTTTGCSPKPYFGAIVPSNGVVSCATDGGLLRYSFVGNDYQGDLTTSTIEIRLDGGGVVYTDTQTFSARGTYTHTGLVQLPQDGTYTIWFTLKDAAGNSETTSRSITTTGCDPRPYFTAWVPGATYDCNGGPINWSVSAADYQSDLVKLQVSISPAAGVTGTANPAVITFPATGSRTFTGSYYLPDDGTYTFTFVATDDKGNTRTQTQNVVTSRCTPKPVITAFAPNTANYVCIAGRLHWSVTAVDYQNDMNKIVVDIKNTSNASIPGMPVTRTFGNTGSTTETGSLILPYEGAFTLVITAHDAAGNVSHVKTQSFTTDKCDPNPRITAYTPNTGLVNCAGDMLNWQFRAEDYQSDLVYMGVQITDDFNEVFPIEAQSFSGVGLRVVAGKHQLRTNGTTKIKFIARDSAGNETTLVHEFITQHCTPPVDTPGIQTRAGDMGNAAGDTDGVSTNARFNQPGGISADLSGRVYSADTFNDRIRLVATNGTVSTLAGTGNKGYGDGATGAATFNQPEGIVYDTVSNDIYVADTGNNLIRRIRAGTVTTIAGDRQAGSIINGTGTGTRFSAPRDVTVFGNNLYVADTYNDAVRVINKTSLVTTTLSTAVYRPWGIATDRAGNVWVAEPYAPTGRVTKLSPGGAVLQQFSGLGQPHDVTVDFYGNVYVSDAQDNVIKRIANGVVSTVGGTSSGGQDGDLNTAQLHKPLGITVTGGHLYINDHLNNRLRKMSIGSYLWMAGDDMIPPSSWIVT